VSVVTAGAKHRQRAAPKSAGQRTERLGLRLTPDELAQIRQGAEARRMSITAFIIEAALSSVDRAISEDRRTVVANAVFDRLVDEMEEPAQVIDSLAKLLTERRGRAHLPG
jgi:uncharacterized protein (DUF1778 family)